MKIHYQLNRTTFFFKFYNTKIKIHPITSKIDRGGCRLFFKSAYPPPSHPVLCKSPAIKSNDSYYQTTTPKYCAAHPSVLFICIFFWTRDLTLTHYLIQSQKNWQLDSISMVISAHTRDTIFIIQLQQILSVPVVLLAVHSSCSSRCPQTILGQVKTTILNSEH